MIGDLSDYEKKNRERLIDLLRKISDGVCPAGWRKHQALSIGGLIGIGFSRKTEHLLVVSHQGRGVIDCMSGMKVARDNEVYGDWLNEISLTCAGIGPIEGEVIQLAGLHGGGLPTTTSHGEILEMAAPNWPRYDLYFCANSGSPLIDGHQTSCVRVASDYICAFGFSWSGNTFAIATSSDVSIYSRTSCE